MNTKSLKNKESNNKRGATVLSPGEFPLGSLESRAAARLRLQETDTGKHSPACICFPDEEQPSFQTSEERDVAQQLQCPLHGVRFDIRRTMHIYVAKWRWENEVTWRRPRLSTQYHKAWQASLPPEPGEPPFPQHRPVPECAGQVLTASGRRL